MKVLKIALAVGLLASGVVLETAPAQADRGWHGRGHRHRVCRTVWHHGHRIRDCRMR